MNKLFPPTLATSTPIAAGFAGRTQGKNQLLVAFATSTLIAAGFAIASPQADIGFDPNRFFFRYTAPGVDSGAFQVPPDNVHNPIVLPCDVQMFGGGIDIHHAGVGPAVFPKLTATYFDHTTQIVSGGCLKNQLLPDEWTGFNAMPAGSVQNDRYILVDSTNPFCASLFQPSDLPADTVVRVHLQLTAYPDATRQGSRVDDPNPANNGHDIYVRRSCSCQ
jgi:hypothetical protein